MPTFEDDAITKIRSLVQHEDPGHQEQGMMLLVPRYKEGIRDADELRMELRWNGFDDVVFLRVLTSLLELGVDWALATHELDLRGSGLEDLNAFPTLPRLRKLNLSRCRWLQNIDGLARCTQLEELDLYGCIPLQNIDGLASCRLLQMLVLDDCRSVQNIDALANCPQLRELVLRDCESLQHLDGVANCSRLTTLDLSGCPARLQKAYQWKSRTDFVLPATPALQY